MGEYFGNCVVLNAMKDLNKAGVNANTFTLDPSLHSG